ncbi:isoamylase early set domain-containing protein [Desulfoplanes formicivorans]|uniref:Glycoside hydrolase n=1 Tax=Desulfoplanes formicivorans TaxID=1592317 RepID=A0A194AL29_9BACT|nr:isoamylase early set domain-containing protein [Desulfoplanes formicivorans]GAU09394.1 glycoside hydrolase [Desulfoplanes formicivorans]
MSIQKKYLKTKPVCKVTFRVAADVAPNAKQVNLVGDFNNWDASATPMTRLKNGSFKVCVNLEIGREYQFRYLVDEKEWENDCEADKFVATPYGDSENSVIVV